MQGVPHCTAVLVVFYADLSGPVRPHYVVSSTRWGASQIEINERTFRTGLLGADQTVKSRQIVKRNFLSSVFHFRCSVWCRICRNPVKSLRLVVLL